ncbi:RIP metalloprotease RseP [Hippea alviniae]|uniref:RIP metalloprotease RseP n=1 Tax=Hippea alviniae TaxID=1279027 RepID=UPI0003B4A69B|nr:RIP metalloprotease RseP [Hippea alviniae]
MNWIYGIAGLVLMVIIHEFGHFIVARILGVGVERFSVGFGPVLFKIKPKKTEYALSLILLGGYVKLKGESPNDEIEDTSDAFFAQPLWKRFLIVLAGPVFNIASAVLFFALAYNIGMAKLAPVVGKVMPNSEAAKIGLQKGDRIIAVNGISVKSWDEMSKLIKANPNRRITIKIKRDGKIIQMSATPKGKKIKDMLGYERFVGLLGILPSGDRVIISYPFLESLVKGAERTVYVAKVMIVGLVRLIEGAIPSSELGGPVMIVDIAGRAAQSGISYFFAFIALISINLGILNLLPIPVLDGGHLMFYTIEAIRGKPVSEKAIENFQKIGIVILLALMLFAFMNDFKRYGVFKYVKDRVEQVK